MLMSSAPRIIFLIVCFFLFASTSHASEGISVNPSYQYLQVSSTATASAKERFGSYTPFTNPDAVNINQATIIYTNHTSIKVNLSLSLAHIQATDLMGRLQFNAPLPQSIIPTTSDLALINPPSLSLEPGQVATASVSFNPAKIEPGKTAYLLLANVDTPDIPITTNSQQIKHVIGSSIVIKDPVNAIPKLELRGLDWTSLPITVSLPDLLTITIKNSGTGPATPRGLIQITDNFNRELVRGPVNDTSIIILPKSERIVYSHLSIVERPLPLSLVTLTLNGYDELKQSNFSIKKTVLLIQPLPLIISIIILGILLLLIKKKIRNHA